MTYSESLNVSIENNLLIGKTFKAKNGDVLTVLSFSVIQEKPNDINSYFSYVKYEEIDGLFITERTEELKNHTLLE